MTTSTSPMTDPPPPPLPGQRHWTEELGFRVALWFVIGIVLVASFWVGVKYRKWAFDSHQPLRFYSDIERGWYWGHYCLTKGYFEPYELMKDQPSEPNSMMWLDYAPLRLGAMTFWAWVNKQRGEQYFYYQDTYEFTKPILFFNIGIEVVLCAGLFVLTRHWLRQCDANVLLGGNLHALIVALVAWFNPANVLSAHCWPTWDIWVPAFFVWAVYTAVRGWWFVSGLIIGAGLMMKGQHFFVVPMFILWPLFMGKWLAPVRWVIGAALAIAVIASPWLLTTANPDYSRAIDWRSIGLVAGVMIAAGAVLGTLKWAFSQNVPLKVWSYVLAGALAASLLMCLQFFDGHDSWVQVAWGFGTRHWDAMMTGPGSNLAALLEIRFRWRDPHEQFWGPLTIKKALLTLYGVTLTLCCIGMAMQFRRKDRRFLIAVVTPWVLFFAFCPKLHERYLAYAAAMSALLVVFGLGTTLLSIFISAVAWEMTISVMFAINGSRSREFGASISPDFANSLIRSIRLTHPDMAWAVVLCALLMLYMSMTPSRRRPPKPAMPVAAPPEQALPEQQFAPA